MVKTQNRKNKKNRKNNKKTKKVYGGEPTVITVQGLYDDADKELVAYYILHNKMNDDQKEKYAEKHKVYIPSKSFFEDLGKMFEINPKKLKKLVNKYFYPGKSTVTFFKPPIQSIAINDNEDIKQIEMANQIIGNIDTKTFFNALPKTIYDNSAKNIATIIKEYKDFISDSANEKLLLDGFISKTTTPLTTPVFYTEDGNKMLKSPVFLKIIGEKYGIFDKSPNDWPTMVTTEGGLDKIYEKLK